MNRLVTPRTAPGLEKAGPPAGDALKEYAERVAKYVPAEILAGYVAMSNFIAADPGLGNPWRIRLWVASFVICAVLTPVYLSRMANPGQPKALHLVIATIAFAVWAYATGDAGLFGPNGWNWFFPGVSGALLVVFSLVSGLFAPKPTP